MKPIPVIVILAWIAMSPADLLSAADVEMIVREKGMPEPMPARVHLYDAAGKAIRAPEMPFFKDHFSCPGRAKLKLEAGQYSYEVERGPEFSKAAGSITVEGDAAREIPIELTRLVDLAAEGWWSGETHVHRALGDVELAMRAEDLHIAPIISWWNNQNFWAKNALPVLPYVQFDRDRFYHMIGGEDERNGGALLYFNLHEPINISGSKPEFPSPVTFLNEARRISRAWVDIEKPFWWDVPTWIATGQCDSIGIANNHMCRSTMYEDEAWGKPRDTKRLPAPLGNGYWTQEIYYQLLNSGVRIPPSAGSASGVLPNPVGYNRVYVQCGKHVSWDSWWEGLRAGHCFVTNGPLLRVTANGEIPGHVFKKGAGKSMTLKLNAKITSRDPIAKIEIIRNGNVERTVSFADWEKSGSLGELTFNESGWFLVRAITDNAKTFRFASTAPFYVEIGETKSRISKSSAQFFLDWVRERMKRIKTDEPAQLDEVLKPHLQAEEFWKKKVEAANAE